MKIVEELTVRVTYRVGLGNVEMPEQVYKQLIKAQENGHDIESCGHRKEYQEASEWLVENIQERDCMDWEAEIEELS